MAGVIRHIFISPDRGLPMLEVAAARVLAGRGIEGDRYAAGRGTFSRWEGEGRAVSLIAIETVEQIEQALGQPLWPGVLRRNIVTQGIDLSTLIGRRFTLGSVTLRGTRECTECKYLTRLTGIANLHNALRARAGLRADALTDGPIEKGDAVIDEWGVISDD